MGIRINNRCCGRNPVLDEILNPVEPPVDCPQPCLTVTDPEQIPNPAEGCEFIKLVFSYLTLFSRGLIYWDGSEWLSFGLMSGSYDENGQIAEFIVELKEGVSMTIEGVTYTESQLVAITPVSVLTGIVVEDVNGCEYPIEDLYAPGPPLVLTFNNFDEMPVSDINDVAEWNNLVGALSTATGFQFLVVDSDNFTISLYGLTGGAYMPNKFDFVFWDDSTIASKLITVDDQGNWFYGIGLVGGPSAIETVISLEAENVYFATFDQVPIIQTDIDPIAIYNQAFRRTYSYTTNGNVVGTANFPRLTNAALPPGNAAAAFEEANFTHFIAPNLLYIDEEFFIRNTSLETVDCPEAVFIGITSFYDCTSLTLVNAPKAVMADPTNVSIFGNIVGQVITVNVAAVNATSDGGNPHASLVYLAANNTANIIYHDP